MRRNAATLIELLVVIGLLALLVGLLLPAVQACRGAAARLQDEHQIRQITLALHSYDSAQGCLPGKDVPSIFRNGLPSPLYNILPYLEIQTVGFMYDPATGHWHYPVVKLYLSPSDPTVQLPPDDLKKTNGATSYPFNAVAFDGRPRFVASFPDGTSQTIAIGQRNYLSAARQNESSYMYLPSCGLISGTSIPYCSYTGERSGSFADAEFLDVVPTTFGSPPHTRPSDPGRTFQNKPLPAVADGRLPHSFHTAGLIVGMFDGSTRVISPSVSPELFWSLVTPAGGETVE
jgi:type II secretory pathway pseudopilin PulG